MKTLLFLLPFAVYAQPVANIRDVISCPNSPTGAQPYSVPNLPNGDLRKIVINSPNAVCNDGTPAVIYVRPARPGATEPDGPSANRWLIHFLGGSSCSSYEECGTRWCGIGQWSGRLMTTAWEGETTTRDGIFKRDGFNRIADRNLVLLKYCSSDQWQGRKSDVVLRSETDPSRAYSLHFRGATIVGAIFDALERGVTGLPPITQATDVLISGDSAGAAGARAHLDRLAARLRANNPNVRVRGHFEATFNPDLNGKQGFPAGDPRDPVYQRKMDQYRTVHVGLRDAQLDDSCLAAHPTAGYLCADDGYLTLNHITTPFFQMQDIQDQLMVNGFQDNGSTATDVEFARALHDQLTALTNIRNTAVERSAIPAAPAVAARNCGVHVAYGDDDGFFGKRIRSGPGATPYSYYDLLWNFLSGGTPSTLFTPRPPAAPDPPALDPACDARAPNATPLPAVVILSSAGYILNNPVAPESIVAAFGNAMANVTAVANSTPWPTVLGGLQIVVTDVRGTARNAPIFYVSPTQLLFLIPAGTAPGAAQVQIGNQRVSVNVAATAPALYSAAQNGKGAAAGTYIKVARNGARSEGLLFDPATRAVAPIPAAPGDQIYLILYGTGMRGGPATATVGDVAVPVAGPVAQGQYQGLDQINLGPLPIQIGYGQKEIVVRQGEDLSNAVTVAFRAP